MTDLVADRPIAESRSRKKSNLLDASYRAAVEAQRNKDYKLARSLYERVLDADPSHAQALHWLGVLDFLDGEIELALRRLDKAQALAPNSSEVLDNYGTVLQSAGRLEESADAYRRAIEANSGNVHAIVNLASTMVQLNQAPAAAALARKALALQAGHPGALNVLAHVLLREKKLDEALSAYRQVLAANPRDPEAHYNVGVVLQECHVHAQAVEAYRNAIALNPVPARYYVNLGASLLKLTKVEEAAASYQQGLARDPNLPEAHYNLAICEFLLGHYREASAHYEWRLKVAEKGGMSPPRAVSGPRWDGKPAPDKTLLLVHEQGLGDSIQFIRLATLAAQRVGRVVVEVQPRLKTLFQSLPGIEVYAAGETLPPYDFHAPLMSLIHLLGVEVDQLPGAPTPYLSVEPERVAKWKSLLSAQPGIRVGIRWQGNPKAKVDHGRSIDLRILAPLAAIPGVRLISLQKDEGAEQMASCGFPVEIPDDGGASGSAETLLDTAAIIANLDLVISIDTMIAHLAGALGRPTWVLLKPNCDWRWLLKRTDSPWYPSMRLFRASLEKGWDEAIGRVARTLAKGVEKRLGRPVPMPSALAATVATQLAEAVRLHQMGEAEKAIALYRRVLADEPQNSVALHYLGVAAYQAGRLEEARALLEEALVGAPDNPEAHSNYALVLKRQGHLDQAAVACRRALALRPGYAEAESNLGNILGEMGRYEEALPHYRAAIVSYPERGEFHLNCGQALAECQQLEAAIDEFRLALKARPGRAEWQYDLATALLAVGQWKEGWLAYESRRQTAAYGGITALAQPEWDGAEAKDRVLMLHAEQGLGDTFQFLRFVAEARARVKQVLLVVQPNIKSLVACSLGLGADAVYAYGEPLPSFDLKLPLPSLPYRLGLSQESELGMAEPYFVLPTAMVEKWRARLADAPGLKVGLSWQGNPAARVDKGRSLPLKQLMPLAGVPGVRFISLQKGKALEQMEDLPQGFKLENPDDAPIGPHSFLETAALIQALDLVITTDTAVAHLAGALGKPVWVLLKFAPDWRWQRRRADTPWYPSARLFRQSVRGGWEGVAQEVRAALAIEAGIRRPLPARKPVDDLTAEVDRGLALHQAGRLQEALAVYDAVLNKLPQQIVALHFKGVALYQLGRAAEGEPLIRQALALKPDYLEALGNLGLALKAQGKLDEAVQTYQKAITLHPDYAEAHNNLGNLLAGQKKFEEALVHHQAAARLRPEKVENLVNLGNTLGDLERFAEAEQAFKKALALAPQSGNVLLGLGKVYKLSDRLDLAAETYRQAAKAAPDSADALSNLGVVLREQGNYDEALACYDEALKRKPDHADTWGNLAFALHHLGRLDEAERGYRTMLRFKPEHADAHFGIASILLARGDYDQGWKEYRWRKQLKDFGPVRRMSRPEWDGKPAPGKTLFLYAEQGLGDTLQWARFIKLAAQRVGRIVVEVQKSLVPLVLSAEGADLVTMQGDEVPTHDLQCALMDLPDVLGISLAKLPHTVPYLSVDPERVREWSRRLSGASGLRVGINWQGNPKGAIDQGRSLPLKMLAPLAEISDVRLISLQKGEAAEQMASCGFAVEAIDNPHEYGPGPMSDTAAQMMNMDLIITTDTSIAHLAGALARPVWVMLKADCDWRWMLGRNDTPWYPTMQLFRQPQIGDWDNVIRNVAEELRRIVS